MRKPTAGYDLCTFGRYYRLGDVGRWSPGMRGSGSSDGGGISDFIDGLGPGQLVGRQVLGSPTLGDVQLSMCYQKGFLEVCYFYSCTFVDLTFRISDTFTCCSSSVVTIRQLCAVQKVRPC